MYTFNSNLDKQEYDSFIKNYSMASFMQQYNWANIKNTWASFHCGLYKDNNLVAVCSILVKKIFKNIKLFYIPRGYLIDFTNYDDLEAMTLNIKKLAKKNNAYVVKIDPNFCISDNSINDIEVEHNYSKDYDIKNNNLKSLGYKNTGLHKEMGINMQPQYNMMAPLCDINSNILSEEDVLKSYKSKTRYYLNSFHEKRGITFSITNDLNKIDDFLSLLKETEVKQNITLRNKEYFERIMKNYKDQAYLVFGNMDLSKYLKYLIENNGKEEEIEEVKSLIIEKENILTLSTGLIILPQNEKGIRTSEYLYAGNSSKFTKLHVSDGLVFELIKFSIKNNCNYCNLGGVDGNLNDHLSMFKQKFNARVMIFTGEYDLPISKIYYPIKLFYPILLKIYKKLLRRNS